MWKHSGGIYDGCLLGTGKAVEAGFALDAVVSHERAANNDVLGAGSKSLHEALGQKRVYERLSFLPAVYGTRLSEETSIRPKPIVEIGNKPILWHIVENIYAHFGLTEFVILGGYKVR